MTSDNYKDADRMGISIRQQQTIINNTFKALGTTEQTIGKSAVYKARIKSRLVDNKKLEQVSVQTSWKFLFRHVKMLPIE